VPKQRLFQKLVISDTLTGIVRAFASRSCHFDSFGGKYYKNDLIKSNSILQNRRIKLKYFLSIQWMAFFQEHIKMERINFSMGQSLFYPDNVQFTMDVPKELAHKIYEEIDKYIRKNSMPEQAELISVHDARLKERTIQEQSEEDEVEFRQEQSEEDEVEFRQEQSEEDEVEEQDELNTAVLDIVLNDSATSERRKNGTGCKCLSNQCSLEECVKTGSYYCRDITGVRSSKYFCREHATLQERITGDVYKNYTQWKKEPVMIGGGGGKESKPQKNSCATQCGLAGSFYGIDQATGKKNTPRYCRACANKTGLGHNMKSSTQWKEIYGEH
jgi:hypothetical protein